MTTTPGPGPHTRLDASIPQHPPHRLCPGVCLARCVRRCQLHVHDSFKSSIEDLKNVDIVKSGTSGLQAAVDKVKTSLLSLRTSAAYEAKDQIQAVEDSPKNLETAISNVSSGGEAAVVTAAATVVSSGSALVQSLQDIDCN
jgi:hypothetical protein